MTRFFKFILILLALASCKKIEETEVRDPEGKEQITFQATAQKMTKTSLNEQAEVIWDKDDQISVFSSTAPDDNERFSSSGEEGRTTEFTGKAKTGSKYTAVYPYSSGYKLKGNKLSARIQANQKAEAGSFDKGANFAVAVSTNKKLEFKNSCALVAFVAPELEGKNITKAIFKGNMGEKIAGAVTAELSSSGAFIRTDDKSLNTITLSGNLEAGKTYYIVTAPQTYAKGISINFLTDNGESFVSKNRDAMTADAGRVTTLEKLSFTTDGDIKKIEETYHIYTEQGLVRFAELVNNGESDADAILENDIDMDLIDNWTPIGKSTVKYETVNNRAYSAVITGKAYSGTFDGNQKTIFNLKLKAAGSVAGNTTGLFGTLDQANVKDLVLGKTGDNSLLDVRTTGDVMQETGVLAGLCHESVITNITNYVPIRYNGTSTQRVTTGVIGTAHSDRAQSFLERVVNKASITVNTNGNKENRWGTAIHVGGICGAAFSAYESGNNEANSVTFISYCENYGNISSDSGRTAGIVGAAPYYTVLNSCFNHGTITSSNSDSGYAAGMCVYMSTMSGMQDCINNGNVIGTKGAGVAGLVCLCSYEGSNFSACANFGDIISDSALRGVFVAKNSAASRWMSCTAAGHVGTYNNNSFRYDSYPENEKLNYLGPGADYLRLENTIWQMGTTEIPEGPEPELRILFIGNSFTQDAVFRLPNILEGAGIKTVELGLMYWGGSTIAQHAENFETGSTNFTYYRKPTSIDGTWLQYKGYTLEDAVKEHDWDIITIQEHTGRVHSWTWSPEEEDAIRTLIEKIKKAQAPHVPELWYIFTQAYHDLSKASGVKNNFNSTEEHYVKIAAQAKKVKETFTELKGIIPSGTVLQNLRGSSLNNDLALTRDGYHMDYGLSRYAAACAVYEQLVLDHFPDKTLEKNTWRTNESGTGKTPVTDQNKPLAIQAARKAIEKPFEVSAIE